MTDAVDRLTSALADRYRIERQLGHGGMATVYLAEDLKHDRKVALKVLKPELAAVLGAERFVQEIKTTAALQHPHILPLFDSGSADGFLYYVMPYIEGETLRTKLDREKQLSIEEAVRITREVADALDYAHRHGVIHRDIKPGNILLHDGRPIVADFGIALAVSAAAGDRMTETGLSLGTPHYMSPEQATAQKDLTSRSDIYSLGSVLFELLAGTPPHTGASPQQIVAKIVTEEAVPVSRLRKSVPPNIAAAVAKALEKLPADRFDNAQAFAQALADPHFTTPRAAASGATSHGATASGRAIDPRSLAVGAIGTAGLAGLVWIWAGRAGAPSPPVYDVGLPDSAPLGVGWQQPFTVGPAGDFVVYTAKEGGATSLWYRSLRDASSRRIAGTGGGARPSLSPDGTRLAFAKWAAGSQKWTLDIVPLSGGASVTLGEGSSEPNIQWLEDGRIQVVDEDGLHGRWFDPGGGPTEDRRINYCILPVYLANRDRFLCGGGGNDFGLLIQARDDAAPVEPLWTGPDSAGVFGSDFHLVEGRYLVYLSVGGDILAAPVDLSTRRVGRSVRLVTGIERSAYFGAGSFALARSGALVYAQGPNYAVGNLVTTDGVSFDTLNVGQEAFRLFAMSPDRRRLAAVVDGLQGEELRIYDLQTGEHHLLWRRTKVRQPVWSPLGDRLIFTAGDSVFLADGDGSAPEFLAAGRNAFEVFSWTRENRVVGGIWNGYQAISLDPTTQPVGWDTLASGVEFPVLSPDGRWLAYTDVGGSNVYLSPVPARDKRYLVAPGWEPLWLSSRELTYGTSATTVARASIDVSGGVPVITKRAWATLPEWVGTAGQSAQLTPDNRILYSRAARPEPRRYLRVVPDWVRQMKRTVDEANR